MLHSAFGRMYTDMGTCSHKWLFSFAFRKIKNNYPSSSRHFSQRSFSFFLHLSSFSQSAVSIHYRVMLICEVGAFLVTVATETAHFVSHTVHTQHFSLLIYIYLCKFASCVHSVEIRCYFLSLCSLKYCRCRLGQHKWYGWFCIALDHKWMFVVRTIFITTLFIHFMRDGLSVTCRSQYSSFGRCRKYLSGSKRMKGHIYL